MSEFKDTDQAPYSAQTATVSDEAGQAVPNAPQWPPLKKAIWRIIWFEKLNSGEWVSPSELTEKLYVAIRALSSAEPAEAPAVEWQWWGGYNDEHYAYGPHLSKETVLDEALHDRSGEFQDEEGNWKIGIFICEAQREPLRLADWIDAETILERAEDNLSDSDRVASEYDEGPWFECTSDQSSDLEARIKAACDDWQKAHGLKFVPSTFSNQRNSEFIVVDHPEAPTLSAGRTTEGGEA